MTKQKLTLDSLCREASEFAKTGSVHTEPVLFGVTDGKAIGTYLEHKFREHLKKKYEFKEGSSAEGIDFPELDVDIKVTSIKQPQSSGPFRSARQKIFGLGYSLIVFVYDKTDDHKASTSRLNILDTIFVDQSRTADFQTTSGVLKILENDGNEDDLVAFMEERNLPVDEIEAHRIASDILKKPPLLGYLTISRAMQWRLQYSRVIREADRVSGIVRILQQS
ncbi:MAG: restriction endonuclease [Chloroflexi bacterium]|nr:restriction endonuclease [Chloroflexota bacterium]